MALASISNIGFYLTSGYFDTDASVKPLLQSWSLSVEEQFYLVWLLLLAVLLRRQRYVFSGIAAIALCSLIASQWMVIKDSDAAFYLMPFRIFEFAMGALLHAIPEGHTNRLKRYHNSAVLLGLACVAYSVLRYSNDTSFPGVAALLPCFGAGLMIWGKDSPISAWILGNRVIVWIGTISYALYLTHWPIILLYERFRTIYTYQTNPSHQSSSFA